MTRWRVRKSRRLCPPDPVYVSADDPKVAAAVASPKLGDPVEFDVEDADDGKGPKNYPHRFRRVKEGRTLRQFIREMLEVDEPSGLTPMMQSDHLTGGPFVKLIGRILTMRSYGMSYEEIAQELVKDNVLQHEDIMNAIAGARVREEMGDRW